MTAAEAITIIQAKGQASGECRCKRSNASTHPSTGCPICAGTGTMHLCATCKGCGINPMTSSACGICGGVGYDPLPAQADNRERAIQAKHTHKKAKAA